MHKFKPDEIVKCCNNIERGVRFDRDGVGVCCCSTKVSPFIISPEEMASGKVNYDLILERRHELLECVNGLNNKYDVTDCLSCSLLKEKEYKDIDLTNLGGPNLCSGFNIAHFSSCNLKCTYCPYATFDKETNNQYSNIVEFIEEYRKRGKILDGTQIDYNGGEPTLLKDFEKILDFLIDNKIGRVTLYSNCVKYNSRIYQALKQNKITLITSPDCALPSTSKNIKQISTFHRIYDTIVKYRNSGTNNLVIKYVIADENRSDDDLYSFVNFAAALGPKVIIGICPSYPYGDREIPEETVEFGAKLAYMLEKYTGKMPLLFSDYSTADEKFLNYSKEVRERVAQKKKEKPLNSLYNLNKCYETNKVCKPKRNLTFKELIKRTIKAIKLYLLTN